MSCHLLGSISESSWAIRCHYYWHHQCRVQIDAITLHLNGHQQKDAHVSTVIVVIKVKILNLSWYLVLHLVGISEKVLNDRAVRVAGSFHPATSACHRTCHQHSCHMVNITTWVISDQVIQKRGDRECLVHSQLWTFFSVWSRCPACQEYMSHSQMLGKNEYGGGPIFKVVLEC